jgi:hypothetical protein
MLHRGQDIDRQIHNIHFLDNPKIGLIEVTMAHAGQVVDV